MYDIVVNKHKQRENLDDQLDAILKIAVQYPYLESDAFSVGWKPDFDKDNEKYLRYDVYCDLLFNFLSRVAAHFEYLTKRRLKIT